MHGLLSTAERISVFPDAFFAFFNNFKAMYAVEIMFFFLVIYFVSKILRENDATKLMFGYWMILLVGGAITVFADNVFDVNLMNGTVYLAYVVLVSAFMLILFNVEVKKTLWDVHSTKVSHSEKTSGGNAEIRSHADTERCISNVIKALQNMSKNNVGALIVLSKGSLPKQVLQSGVVIEAEIFTDYEYAAKKKVKDIRSTLQEILDEYNLKAPLYKRVIKLKIRETEFEKNTTKKIKHF